MNASYDVIVLGGGAVGAACARELATSGRRVLVIDRGPLDGAAWPASAGMLAPQIEAHAGDPLFDIGLAGRAQYAGLAQSLRSDTGIDIGLWQNGIVRVADDEPDAVDLRAKVAWQRQRGHLSDWLDATEVRARWPWLAPTHGALWAPREGSVDPVALVRALLADAERHGAVLVRETAVALEQRDGRVSGVRAAERYAAPSVVLAAGAWSGRLAGLPRPVSVEPLRGQMISAPWPAGVPRAIVYRDDAYALERGGEMIVGATREFVGFDAGTTPSGIAELTESMRSLGPALAGASPTRAWAGLRPVTPDGLPIIGAEPRLPGLWYATGHGRNGILLAAVTGTAIRQLLDGHETIEQLAPMRPDRFWS